MIIKLIAIDIDGTLINSHHELTERTKEAITKAKEQGIKIVVATGRPYPGVANILKELGLEDKGDYVITYNGSLVQECDTKKAIVSHGLSYDNFIEIEALSRRLGSHLHSIDRENIYTANQHISPYTIHEASLTGMPLHYRAVDQMTADMEIVKMMMIDEPTILDEVISKLPSWFTDKYTTTKSAPFYLEVLNKQANKGIAVKELADYLGIKQEETMAIGDNENDLEMIEYAGMGVAMANAVPKLKAAANYETLSNDEDGVAVMIEKHLS